MGRPPPRRRAYGRKGNSGMAWDGMGTKGADGVSVLKLERSWNSRVDCESQLLSRG